MASIKHSSHHYRESLERLLAESDGFERPDLNQDRESPLLFRPLTTGRNSGVARAISLGLVIAGLGFFFESVNPGSVSAFIPGTTAIQRLFVSPVTASNSTLTGVVDPITMTSSFYWTLVLKSNTGRQEEAVADVVLPEGAVVSRATLWVNGIPQEAAFNSTSKVSFAYQEVAHPTFGFGRDPLLVTWKAPNKVSIKAFPVPSGGELQIRLGITAPLNIDLGGNCSVSLPSVENANFNIQKQDVHVESPTKLSTSEWFANVDNKPWGRSVLKLSPPASRLNQIVIGTQRPADLRQVATRATHAGKPSYIVGTVKDDEGEARIELTRQDSKPDCRIITSDHAAYRLSSLWASQAIDRQLAEGNGQAATEIGTAYRVVSPITGATVLENNRQYTDFGLHRDRYMTVRNFDASLTTGVPPMLQGSTNGTIGPQQGDAIVVAGVNTAGTVRVSSDPYSWIDWWAASARDANLFDGGTTQVSAIDYKLGKELISWATFIAGMVIAFLMARFALFPKGASK